MAISLPIKKYEECANGDVSETYAEPEVVSEVQELYDENLSLNGVPNMYGGDANIGSST